MAIKAKWCGVRIVNFTQKKIVGADGLGYVGHFIRMIIAHTEKGEKMDNKGKKVLEEAKLLLYPAPNCVEYCQMVKATADEVARRIFEAMSDTVTVVRCKDCKWWKTNYSWNGNEHKICVREAYEPLRNAEDFCSRGERRKDD